MQLVRIFIPLAPCPSGPHRLYPLTTIAFLKAIPHPPLSPMGFQELQSSLVPSDLKMVTVLLFLTAGHHTDPEVPIQ